MPSQVNAFVCVYNVHRNIHNLYEYSTRLLHLFFNSSLSPKIIRTPARLFAYICIMYPTRLHHHASHAHALASAHIAVFNKNNDNMSIPCRGNERERALEALCIYVYIYAYRAGARVGPISGAHRSSPTRAALRPWRLAWARYNKDARSRVSASFVTTGFFTSE